MYISKTCFENYSQKKIRDFWTQHKDCEQQLKSWFQETNKVHCQDFASILIIKWYGFDL